MGGWRWNWYAAIGAGGGAIIGAIIAGVVAEPGWTRTLLVGLCAGVGAALGQAWERRSGAGGA